MGLFVPVLAMGNVDVVHGMAFSVQSLHSNICVLSLIQEQEVLSESHIGCLADPRSFTSETYRCVLCSSFGSFCKLDCKPSVDKSYAARSGVQPRQVQGSVLKN